jgi:hypothetical protein
MPEAESPAPAFARYAWGVLAYNLALALLDCRIGGDRSATRGIWFPNHSRRGTSMTY